MASGQQEAQQNLEAFEVWKAAQTDDDFKQIVFRGHLNRIEVAKGVLPPLTDAAKKNADKPQAYDNTANRKLLDSKRVSSLEAENIELKAKVKELEKRLERFGELSETLSELGLLPR